MNQTRIDEIKMWCDHYEDLPDGAFFAILENEHGIEAEEIAAAYEESPEKKKE